MHELLGWRQGGVTHRQFVCWRLWTEMQWSRPSRGDYYVMQLTALLHQVNSRKSSIKAEDYKIVFTTPGAKKKTPKLSREVASAFSKAKWCAGVGMTPEQISAAKSS